MTGWYCFRTRPNREVVTTHALRQAGFRVILLMQPPLVKAHRKHKHPGKTRLPPKRQPLPALRPYIFVDMSAPDAWKRLHEERAEVAAVGIDGQPPCPLSKAGLRFIQLSNREMFHDEDWPKYSKLPPAPAYDAARIAVAPGDEVRIGAGPFTGFEGRCVDIRGDEAKVLVMLFGRENLTRLPARTLAPARRAS